MMENILEQLVNYWAILLVLGAQFAATIRRTSRVDSRLNRLEEHANDLEKHWSTEKKMKVFVPRTEIEQRFDNVDRILRRIDKKLDK